MDVTQEVNVGSALPLPRPFILLEQPTKGPLCLITLFRDDQLNTERERGGHFKHIVIKKQIN